MAKRPPRPDGLPDPPSEPTPRGVSIAGEVFSCPTCVVGCEEHRNPAILIPIRQYVRTPGASARLLFLCPVCGSGIQIHCDIVREIPIREA